MVGVARFSVCHFAGATGYASTFPIAIKLYWLLVASIGEIDVLIVSLLLFFDNQYTKWRADFPTRAILASSAVKHSHQKAHNVLILPLIWENRQRDAACWRHTLCYVLKASTETFSVLLRRALLQFYGKAHALLR